MRILRALTIVSLLVFLTPSVSLFLSAQALAANVRIIVNGQEASFDQPPIEQSGRIFVPLRGVFERLGASVVYNNGLINATGNGRNIQLHIGSTAATINGQPASLDVAPFLVGARTLVPLRFISESLGANVNYDGNSRTVTVAMGAAAAPPPPAATVVSVINIVASNWKFTPDTITVAAGRPVTLRLTSTSGVHGIQSDELGIPQTAISQDQFVRVTFTPRAGTYVIHCSIQCGAGHSNMTLTIAAK
jgi:heme/copper-type cytochrome/quinol oxidase subunit 2